MAQNFIIETNFLNKLRSDLKERFARATYLIGSTEYDGYDLDVDVLANGQVEATFMINMMNHPGKTVTEVRLYDTDDDLVGTRGVSITVATDGTAKALEYACRFKVYQSES